MREIGVGNEVFVRTNAFGIVVRIHIRYVYTHASLQLKYMHCTLPDGKRNYDYKIRIMGWGRGEERFGYLIR